MGNLLEKHGNSFRCFTSYYQNGSNWQLGLAYCPKPTWVRMEPTVSCVVTALVHASPSPSEALRLRADINLCKFADLKMEMTKSRAQSVSQPVSHVTRTARSHSVSSWALLGIRFDNCQRETRCFWPQISNEFAICLGNYGRSGGEVPLE